MDVDAKPTDKIDASGAAKKGLQIGPPPDWVTQRPIHFPFKASEGDALTYLLLDQQLHAEERQLYTHLAVRLETMASVQHNSQWRVEFEPRTQSMVLHSIKVHRNGAEFEQANLEKIHVLQRESGLERFTIDGWYTLLLLLEDVRPGDVLEWSFTTKTVPRLLAEHCSYMFTLPPAVPVGEFYFAVRFNETRAMQWKAADSYLKPAESKEGDLTRWVWEGRQDPGKLEGHTPAWHLAYLWVQISDCAKWETVAAAVTKAWEESADDGAAAEIARELAEKEPELLQRVEKILQLVQDEYRYLSVNVELGGQVPTAPGTVARRRYGDCKDLSFLLVHLLKQAGVAARPILVHTLLRKTVGGMLPMAGIFNHAIVELKIDGQTRWIDPTIKQQGGGVLNRFVPEYGVGLPLDGASGLVESPHNSTQVNVYELKESVLLDTTGAPSFLAVVLQAKGNHAESLKQHLDTLGEEKFASERLQDCANKFRNAKRVLPLAHRYDRATNEFVLAEVFEINGFLLNHQNPKVCSFPMANNLVTNTLLMPEKGVRKTPFALPHPCNIVHTMEVQSPGIRESNFPRAKVETPQVQFSRNQKFLRGYCSMTLTLRTLADAVAPEQVENYRKTVAEIWKESKFSMLAPLGFEHPRRRTDFGALPLPQRKPMGSAPPKPVVNAPVEATTVTAPVANVAAAPEEKPVLTQAQGAWDLPVPSAAAERVEAHRSPRPERTMRERRKRHREPQGKGGIIIAVFVIGVIVLAGLLIWMAR